LILSRKDNTVDPILTVTDGIELHRYFGLDNHVDILRQVLGYCKLLLQGAAQGLSSRSALLSKRYLMPAI